MFNCYVIYWVNAIECIVRSEAAAQLYIDAMCSKYKFDSTFYTVQGAYIEGIGF